MSKSVGNVLDPLAIVEGRTLNQILENIETDSTEELEHWKKQNENGRQFKAIEKEIKSKIKEARIFFQNGIAESGADPLRMALIDYTRQTRQINMELRHVDTFRKLGIKIDNAFKFFHHARKAIEESTGKAAEAETNTAVTIKSWIEGLDKEKMRFHDWHMLYHLRELVVVCNAAFEERRLCKATEAIRAFTFDVLCDVYLEFVKQELAVDANPEVRGYPDSQT